jgi:hypothetical protein
MTDELTRSANSAPVGNQNRRSFLKAAAATAVISAGPAATRIGAEAAPPASEAAGMPMVSLGPAKISRLIAGANTIGGGSHLSRFVDLDLREYFTEERIFEFLGRSSHAGINLWQAHAENFEHWLRYRRSGGSMHYISLAHDEPKPAFSIKDAARMGFLGLVHHGEVTDQLFKSGAIEKARDFLKQVRDAGLLVGLSTHMPAVIDYVEEKGWDVDFYMTCVYERHRSRDELKKLLGHVPINVGEVYLEDDPDRMYKMIRATRKPCLAFKILAAGRLCQSPNQVEQAFAATFKNIKPTDAVIVGMWPRWTDQIRENAELARRYGVNIQ